MSKAILERETQPKRKLRKSDNKKAIAAIREFDIHLWFDDGELFKMVKIVHSDWTAAALLDAIRENDNKRLKGVVPETLKGVPDLICAGSEKGELFVDGVDGKGRPSKSHRHRVVIATWRVSDGMGAIPSSFNASYCFDDGSSIEL